MTPIPYDIAFHIFVIVFFGGLGLTYIVRAFMIKRYIETNKRKILLWTIISGALTGLFWFYLLTIILFPNYLFQIGIVSIL